MEVGKSKAAVRIAAFSGELPAAAVQWTRRPLARLFKVGDVALFRVLAVDKGKKKLDLGLEQEPLVDGAILAVDNKTGEIKAMVGGYAFEKSKFNRAIQALRQTGSTFKPIIYTAALEHGFSAATIIQDEPFSYVDEWTGELWEPHNHKGDFLGPLTFRRGLELSRNVVTARILQAITPEVGLEYARKFGITSELKPYMSMSLGAFEVTLKEMVEAFTVFANYGVRVNSYFIRSIRDLNDNIIEENFPERKQVIEKETAFIMNYILQGVVRNGTGWRARVLPAPAPGRQDRHDERFHRRLVHRLHPQPDRGRLGGPGPEKEPGRGADRFRDGPADLRGLHGKLPEEISGNGQIPPALGRVHDQYRQVHRQAADPRLPLPLERGFPARDRAHRILQRRGAPEDLQLLQDRNGKRRRLSRAASLATRGLFLDQEITQQPSVPGW